MTKDLTKGNTLGLIINITLPVLSGYLFQQLYSLVDTMIVGKGVGVDALAAVGSTGSVNFLIIGFCIGTSAGVTIPVAQSFGAGNYIKMRRYIYHSFLLIGAVSVVLTVATVLYCRPLLQLMQTPEDILDQAARYIRIIFMGIPFILLFNLVSSILRAVGNNKTPLIFLILASVLNIILDLVLILVFPFGVAGAAFATICSQGASGLICLFHLKKEFPLLVPEKEDRTFHIKDLIHLSHSGIPMGLQFSVTAIGSVILQVSVNSLGSGAVAAVGAGVKLLLFFAVPFDALGTTMATFGGQNTGARKWNRLKMGVRDSLKIGFAYSLLAFIGIFYFGRALGVLFVDAHETSLINDIYLFMVYQSSSFILLSIVNTVRFMIQGMGFSTFAIIAGLSEMIARAAIGFWAVPVWGYTAVCLSSPAAWFLADLFLIPAFYSCLKRLLTTDKELRQKKRVLSAAS